MHKRQRTDKLCLIAVANEFVACNGNHKRNFGTFNESDFKDIQVTISYCLVKSKEDRPVVLVKFKSQTEASTRYFKRKHNC